MVICNDNDTPGDEDMSASTSRLIVEVLSDRVGAIGSGDTFAAYRRLLSCEEDLPVRMPRRAAGLWTYQRYGPDEALTLGASASPAPWPRSTGVPACESAALPDSPLLSLASIGYALDVSPRRLEQDSVATTVFPT